MITLGILALFVLAPVAPIRFLEIAQAYQMMPDGFWALLSVIIAFYFGGRMQLKGQDMAVKGGALQMAREILTIRRAEQQLDRRAPQLASPPAPQPASPPAPPAPTPPVASPQAAPSAAATEAPRVNQVVEEWRHRQAAGGRL